MAQLTIEQALQIAVQHHHAGRLLQAEPLYRQVLARQPNHPTALHHLGLIAHQVGRHDAAVDLIRRAITLQPDNATAYHNLGNALRSKGQVDEAIMAYRQAITLNSKIAAAHVRLGNLLTARGQYDEAIRICRAGIGLNPDSAEAHYSLGNAVHANGQLDEAIVAYRRVIALNAKYPAACIALGNALQDRGQLPEAISVSRQAIALAPGNPNAHNGLSSALRMNGQMDEAITAARQAISLAPNHAGAHLNLGNALKDKGLLNEAIVAYRQAIALNPGYAEAHSNLGNVLRQTGRLDEAIAAHDRAIALRPNFPEAVLNRANALIARGQFDEAIAAYTRAISLKPGYARAHSNLAAALLTKGDFAQGWEEYEWRWKCDDFPSPQRNFAQPLWDGRPLAGATLLLHAEQGFGDALHFIRYLPLVKQRCGKIIIDCQKEVQRLMKSVAGDFPVVPRGQRLPPFDMHCPLLSLPRLFGTTLENMPRQVPYLHAEPETAQKWRQRLAGEPRSLKVGLVWAGRKSHINDRNRSMALSDLAPLGQIHGVSLYSLQKGEPANQVANVSTGFQFTDWTNELKDFADTAALVANLDLVISVDTAVVHLAGAMGKPVWVMLPFVPDWRWLLEREDSPWYPTMRLFRQPGIGDWESVVRRVADALAAVVHAAVDRQLTTDH